MTSRKIGQKVVRPFSEKQFALQWQKVKQEYPFVAMRYLEALQFILEERRKVQVATSDIVPVLGVCDPLSPTYAGEAFCKILRRDADFSPLPEPPRRCRLPLNEGGIGTYLACLEKRIAGLG
jgi:hypothetical protein